MKMRWKKETLILFSMRTQCRQNASMTSANNYIFKPGKPHAQVRWKTQNYQIDGQISSEFNNSFS